MVYTDGAGGYVSPESGSSRFTSGASEGEQRPRDEAEQAGMVVAAG